MSLNHSLLDEVTERSTKLRCKKIKNYDDAIIDRNSKFIAAKLLTAPLINTAVSSEVSGATLFKSY